MNKVCVCRDRKETVIACWMDFLPAALLIMRAGMMQLSESPKIKPAQGETELCQKRTDELPTLLTLPQQHIQKPQFPQILSYLASLPWRRSQERRKPGEISDLRDSIFFAGFL